MRVYRCIRKSEVINKYKNIKNKKLSFRKNINTHVYDENKEYIHFFRYNEFAQYHYDKNKLGDYNIENSESMLFMVANIPYDLLEKHKGLGIYSYQGKDNYPMPEYAIPVDEFNPDYIVDISSNPNNRYIRDNEKEEYQRYLSLVNRLREKNIDIEQITKLLMNDSFDNLLEMDIDYRTEEEIMHDIEVMVKKFISKENEEKFCVIDEEIVPVSIEIDNLEKIRK